LSQTGIEGPYVLCAHSLSGIEALYWAQHFPDEVQAIVGLDMAVPETYENIKINMSMYKLVAFTANIGITRLIPGAAESDAIKYGTLTAKDKAIYRALFYRRTATKIMLNEVQAIKANASKVDEGGVPDVPILMFTSNGKRTGTGWNEDTWIGFQTNYLSLVDNGKQIHLDCGHYVHDFKYKEIAKDTKEFLNNLSNNK
jgi:pimeloyl-ACP methyl ester carboxylesterase